MNKYDFTKIKKFLEHLNPENIIFKEHFFESAATRPISTALVKETIKKTGALY